MALHPSEESINITRKFLGGGQAGQQSQEDFSSDIPRRTPPGPVRERVNPAIAALRMLKTGNQGAAQGILDVASSSGSAIADLGPGGLSRQQRSRPGSALISPIRTSPYLPLAGAAPSQIGDSLGDRFLGLPGPVGFASTPQGQAILQRILGGIGRRR